MTSKPTKPKPPVPDREPRRFKFPLLTQRELELVDAGPVDQVWIGPKEGYWQNRIIRQPQQVKDLGFAEAAEAIGGKLQRFGVTAADRRHGEKLIELLREWLSFGRE